MTFLDATDPVRSAGDPRALYVMHLNARGYGVIGRYLAERLARRDAAGRADPAADGTIR